MTFDGTTRFTVTVSLISYAAASCVGTFFLFVDKNCFFTFKREFNFAKNCVIFQKIAPNGPDRAETTLFPSPVLA